MTLGIALGIYILFLAVFWFFALTILWHFREYELPGDYSKWIVRMFVGMVVLLNVISLVLLFRLFS